MEWDKLGMGVVNAVAFGLVGIVLAIFGFKLFDWLSPKIDMEKELAEKNNVAIAIVCGAVILGICYIVGQVVGG